MPLEPHGFSTCPKCDRVTMQMRRVVSAGEVLRAALLFALLPALLTWWISSLSTSPAGKQVPVALAIGCALGFFVWLWLTLIADRSAEPVCSQCGATPAVASEEFWRLKAQGEAAPKVESPP